MMVAPLLQPAKMEPWKSGQEMAVSEQTLFKTIPNQFTLYHGAHKATLSFTVLTSLSP
jgi:hypothetical protein